MRDKRKELRSVASDPTELREYAKDIVGFSDGGYGAHADLEDDLNLNAIAIGLGLDNIEYEPEKFAGLVYRVDIEGSETTVILLGDGRATSVDAQSESAAKEAIIKLGERLVEINEAGDEDEDELWNVSVPDWDKITAEKVQ